MSKALRWMLVGFIALAASFGSVARADVDDVAADNVQEGDNETGTEQSGDAASGDAVGGQVTGVVSGGDTSVDATNRSEDVDIETGDADAFNDSNTFTGLAPEVAFSTVSASDIDNVTADNVQEGDNETEIAQSADAASGDGVGGQVIGVVTSAGGSADIVAANTSEDVDIETGDAFAENDADAIVGLLAGIGGTVTASDISNVTADNVQEGDNELSADQNADAASGDGVGGQVLGVVSAGDTSIDATNLSEDVDLETGDSDAFNFFDAFVGLLGDGGTVSASDIFNVTADNVQEGDNEKSVAQDADSASGDAVGGQVAGVVTSAGGSADLVLANTSLDIDAETGDSLFDNFDTSYTGLTANGIIAVF